jgi:hypothetical protein
MFLHRYDPDKVTTASTVLFDRMLYDKIKQAFTFSKGWAHLKSIVHCVCNELLTQTNHKRSLRGVLADRLVITEPAVHSLNSQAFGFVTGRSRGISFKIIQN